MTLYSTILVLTIVFPLILSFDKKVHFYTEWKTVIPSILIVAFFYIIGDIILTKYQVWGFNSSYHSTISILNLPLEEFMFFIIVPYACIFIHYVLKTYFPLVKLGNKFSKAITILLLFVCALLSVFYFENAYTFYILIVTILALIWVLISNSKIINRYYFTFLVMFIPFLLVNSILTGSFIDDEVVWYNNAELIGPRILTIPIEDILYVFSMILMNLLFIELFSKKKMARA